VVDALKREYFPQELNEPRELAKDEHPVSVLLVLLNELQQLPDLAAVELCGRRYVKLLQQLGVVSAPKMELKVGRVLELLDQVPDFRLMEF